MLRVRDLGHPILPRTPKGFLKSRHGQGVGVNDSRKSSGFMERTLRRGWWILGGIVALLTAITTHAIFSQPLYSDSFRSTEGPTLEVMVWLISEVKEHPECAKREDSELVFVKVSIADMDTTIVNCESRNMVIRSLHTIQGRTQDEFETRIKTPELIHQYLLGRVRG